MEEMEKWLGWKFFKSTSSREKQPSAAWPTRSARKRIRASSVRSPFTSCKSRCLAEKRGEGSRVLARRSSLSSTWQRVPSRAYCSGPKARPSSAMTRWAAPSWLGLSRLALSPWKGMSMMRYARPACSSSTWQPMKPPPSGTLFSSNREWSAL